MKLLFGIAALILIVAVTADVSHLTGPSNEYLPPHQHQAGHHAQHDSHGLGRSLEGHSVNREYLPPVEDNEAAPAHTLEADGYHYKTPQRRRFRF